MSALDSNAASNFVDYARRQHQLGAELIRRHTREETGCCRDCGRVFPCEEHEQALKMKEHYEPWLANPPAGLA